MVSCYLNMVLMKKENEKKNQKFYLKRKIKIICSKSVNMRHLELYQCFTRFFS